MLKNKNPIRSKLTYNRRINIYIILRYKYLLAINNDSEVLRIVISDI